MCTYIPEHVSTAQAGDACERARHARLLNAHISAVLLLIREGRGGVASVSYCALSQINNSLHVYLTEGSGGS